MVSRLPLQLEGQALPGAPSPHPRRVQGLQGGNPLLQQGLRHPGLGQVRQIPRIQPAVVVQQVHQVPAHRQQGLVQPLPVQLLRQEKRQGLRFPVPPARFPHRRSAGGSPPSPGSPGPGPGGTPPVPRWSSAKFPWTGAASGKASAPAPVPAAACVPCPVPLSHRFFLDDSINPPAPARVWRARPGRGFFPTVHNNVDLFESIQNNENSSPIPARKSSLCVVAFWLLFPHLQITLQLSLSLWFVCHIPGRSQKIR